MSEEFAPPEEPNAIVAEEDEEATKGGWQIIIPSIFLFIAGSTTATAGLQMAIFTRLQIVPWSLFLTGCLLVLLSAWLTRGSAMASYLSAAVVTVLTVFSFFWNIWLLWVWLISPLHWLMLVTCVVATLTAPIGIPAAQRITRIKKKLWADI